METYTVNCPQCGCTIDVQDILVRQVQERLQQEFQSKITAERKRLEEATRQLEEGKANLESSRREQQAEVRKQVEESLAKERKQYEEDLRARLAKDNEELLSGMRKELEEKSNQVREFNRLRIENEKLLREKSEMREALELEAEKKLTERLRQERESIGKAAEQRFGMHINELQKQLEDQKKLTEEMQRKQEQGSMQLQGEVQELAIEKWLQTQFPMDTIGEIAKGARGADCVQIVNTPEQSNCGMIYYESKRTKDFQPKWISKFKEDMRQQSAHVGVLVSEARPSGHERLCQLDGVWVCTFDEFKSLSAVLRDSVIQYSRALATQENKEDKVHMLYDYLTGHEFAGKITAIVEGFTAMQTSLDKEKNAMQRIWSERQKQIEMVVSNTSTMYGAIRGIAGSAIQTVKPLELPFSEDLR